MVSHHLALIVKIYEIQNADCKKCLSLAYWRKRIYISVKHVKKFDEYFGCLETIFEKIADYESSYQIDKLLEGPICPTFQAN